MSEVTVKAMQPVLGLDDGAVVTIERTNRIDNAIKAGRLVVIDEAGERLDRNPETKDAVAAASAEGPGAAESASDAAARKRPTGP